MNTQYGLIFKDNDDEIWLGKYENGTVREFGALSDFEGIYDDLELSKFAFVEVQQGENEQISLRDVCRFEVGRQDEDTGEETGSVPVTEMLMAFEFPSEESDSMFGSFLLSAGKAN